MVCCVVPDDSVTSIAPFLFSGEVTHCEVGEREREDVSFSLSPSHRHREMFYIIKFPQGFSLNKRKRKRGE